MGSIGRKFDAFHRVDREYGEIAGHPLVVSLFIPKTTKPGASYPVLVHFHGGGFIVGHRLYEPWYADWLLEMALSKGAIIVSPDFRLLPEASPLEVLDDIHCFWEWLHQEAAADAMSWVDCPVNLDLGQIALHGESSGGWLAVQSCLRYPEARIKCVITSSASLDSQIPYLTIPGPKSIMGQPPIPARQAELTIRKYIRGIVPGAIRTATEPTESWHLFICMIQQGYYSRMFNTPHHEDLDIMKAVSGIDDICPIWLMHGTEDTLVPSECSSNFAYKMKKLKPDVPVLLTLRPGEHGFDKACSMQEEWIEEGISFVGKYWP
ncbi:putative polyketide synthase [Aspergillus pseudocaelatus]|uniref:Polyketide synthase n=1 Tax=Aspergillus pseudocaelatus TaxID=1825620 RepID=A0ABQ6X1A9_9EURO|nr:putative polyketide synthase [Aspergillus pseudocaelatus]